MEDACLIEAGLVMSNEMAAVACWIKVKTANATVHDGLLRKGFMLSMWGVGGGERVGGEVLLRRPQWIWEEKSLLKDYLRWAVCSIGVVEAYASDCGGEACWAELWAAVCCEANEREQAVDGEAG